MSKRYDILDILKGFSLLCIFVLHFNQQFEIENSYIYQSDFLNKINIFLKKFVEKVLSGNVYLIFSLIFGINLNFGLKNKSNASFLFRLFLIFVFGFVHSLFYNGDILMFYSILGIALLFINRMRLKYIYIILGISLLKIPLILQMIATLNPEFQFFSVFDLNLAKQAQQTYTSKGILDVFQFNAFYGKCIPLKYYIISDRIGSILTFFILGLIIYKKNVLSKIEDNLPLIKKYMVITVIGLIALFFINKISFTSNFNLAIAINLYLISLQSILTSLLFTLVITYLYYKKYNFNFLKNYGTSSLTIYITQSLIGVFVFYHFGLDLGNKIGLLHGIGFMIIFVMIQLLFLKFWHSKYTKGPFELALFNLCKLV